MSIISDYISQVKSSIEKLPHHKHIGEKIFPTEEVSLTDILELIIDLIK